MNKYAKLIIAAIIILIALLLLCSCDKNCYQCDIEHQKYSEDSISGRRSWDITNIDSTFTVCGYDADAYSGKTVDIIVGKERTYTKCIKK